MTTITGYIEKFKQAHCEALPTEIIVTPRAAVALGLRQELSPRWNGVTVKIKAESYFDPTRIVPRGKGRSLGIFLLKANLAAVELR